MISSLREWEELVLDVTDLEATKLQLIEKIKQSTIRAVDQRKLMVNINSCQTVVKLQSCFYNSLLKFEGQGVAKPLHEVFV